MIVLDKLSLVQSLLPTDTFSRWLAFSFTTIKLVQLVQLSVQLVQLVQLIAQLIAKFAVASRLDVDVNNFEKILDLSPSVARMAGGCLEGIPAS